MTRVKEWNRDSWDRRRIVNNTDHGTRMRQEAIELHMIPQQVRHAIEVWFYQMAAHIETPLTHLLTAHDVSSSYFKMTWQQLQPYSIYHCRFTYESHYMPLWYDMTIDHCIGKYSERSLQILCFSNTKHC